MKRAIVVVIDSMGIGAMPDCKDFGDIPECNTLKNVCKIPYFQLYNFVVELVLN